MIHRFLEKDIQDSLSDHEVTILYGARQVGKSTILQKLYDSFVWSKVFYNCDLQRDRDALSVQDDILLRPLIAPFALVIIDEAQRIPNIWLILKIMHQYFPKTKIIASGSSSFDLANAIHEPLTGRSYQYSLYPLSLEEITATLSSPTQFLSLLPWLLQYGSYPKVYTSLISWAHPQKELEKLTSWYLYKDILAIDSIQKSHIIEKLLKLLALQCWKIVSYTELANKLEINRLTVEKYITILEQSFIIFTLPVYSGNTRKSLGKQQKIYFRDIWIRNALIHQFWSLEDRVDTWELFENFVIAERKKYCSYHRLPYQQYFWRNYAQAEVDLVETTPSGMIYAYEIKLSTSKFPPRWFSNVFPHAELACITKDTVMGHVMRVYK